MGIGLKDLMGDNKSSLAADKQKRTIKRLLLLVAFLAVSIVVVVLLIISNTAKARRMERLNLVARDVMNISNVVKGIGQQYITNNYQEALVGTPLDDSPITINVNGKSVEYRYGYYYITSEEMKQLITSLNINSDDYIVNYSNGDVVNLTGVRDNGGKTYYSLEDIVAVANGEKVRNIIYVHNASEMKLLHQYPNGIFYLSGNIDMADYASGEGWEPISNFSGVFDGRDYTITNLTINRPTNVYCGLFGLVTSNAEIKNINFEQVNIRGGNYTGVLAGSCSGDVSNVTITSGQVNSQAEYVGGLVGAYDKGTIVDCVANDVSVNATGSVGGLVGTLLSGNLQRSSANAQIIGINSVGGLIGEVRPNAETNIKEVFANASITGQNDVGGLIGNVQIISRSMFRISDCYSEGVINGGRENVGGSIGNVYAVNNAQIDIQSVYTATDTPTNAVLRGGFAGKTNIEEGTSIQVLKCCYEKDPLLDLNVVDVGSKVGVIVVVDSKTPAEMKNRVTYADWNFDIWSLDEGVSRPHLKWEYENYEPQVEEEK